MQKRMFKCLIKTNILLSIAIVFASFLFVFGNNKLYQEARADNDLEYIGTLIKNNMLMHLRKFVLILEW